MNRLEFLQGLKAELEGRVPHSIIQENLRYYDSYISDEAAKGQSEEDVVESLGGPRIIARTIVDAALDTEDRPDGFETFGSGPAFDEGQGSHGQRESGPSHSKQTDPHVHYVDFSKWYVRLIAGLAAGHFPDHDRILWHHGPGGMDPVLYLAHTFSHDGGLDVQGAPQIRGLAGAAALRESPVPILTNM